MILGRNFSSKDSSPNDESDIVHLNDSEFIKIPEYPIRPNEPLEQRRQRYTLYTKNDLNNKNHSVFFLSHCSGFYIKVVNEECSRMICY